MRVRLEPDSAGVLFQPVSRLGPQLFAAYQAACRGASFDRDRRCHVATLELVSRIVARLQESRFEIEAHPEVASLVRHSTSAVRQWADAAAERAFGEHVEHLYPYQRDGVVRLASRKRFLLADEPGLGKTRQAIFAAPDRAPVLVVCPAIAKGVWRKEFQALRPEFRVRIIEGRQKPERFRFPEPGEVLVCNYDILPPPLLGRCLVGKCREKRRYGKPTCKKHREEVPIVDADSCLFCGRQRHEGLECLEIVKGEPCPNNLVLVADEAHALKSKKTKRTQAFMQLANVARLRHGYVWLLTGTPLLNRPGELWDLLSTADLAREAFSNFVDYAAMFGATKNYFGGYDWPKDGNVNVPSRVLDNLSEVMLRRKRTEVLADLPGKSYDDIFVDLKRPIVEECEDFIRSAAVELSDPKYLEKVAFKDTSRLRADLASAKIPAMEAFVEEYEEADEPLIVFSAHRKPIDWFGPRPGWGVITGDTPSEERFYIAEAFQAGRLRGVAGTIDSCGVAITLTRACHILFVDLEWTPALNQQAEDRCCRIGQTRPVQVHRLVGDHRLERRVAELLRLKSNLILSLIDSVASKPTEQQLREVDWGAVESVGGKRIVHVSPTSASVEGRRPPKTPIEQWASRGIRLLAGLDEDHARRRNAAGFSRDDVETGHSLAKQLEIGLNDLQWGYAVSLCRRYWRQVGAPPTK